MCTLSVILLTLPPLSIRLHTISCGPNLKGMRDRMDQLGPPNAKHGTKFDTQFLRRNFAKVVIQEVPTRRFWQSTGIWTTDVDKATSFRTCSAALEQATLFRLQYVQLVLTREIKECEVIPLKASFRA